MSATEPTLIVVNPVREEKADDFETWLQTVAVPAVRAQRPDLKDRWHVLRATGADDGTVPFLFVFDGGTDADWDLGALLAGAFGEDGASHALARFGEMLRQEQYGWWCTPVRTEGR